MKKKKLIIPIVAIVVVCVIFLSFFNPFSKKKGPDLTIPYLVSENGEVYFQDIDNSTIIGIESNENGCSYKVLKENETIIDNKVNNKQMMLSLAKEKTLEKGVIYKLVLDEGTTFIEPELKDLREVTFKIRRPNIEIAEFKDNVYVFKTETEQKKADQTKLYQPGNIIISEWQEDNASKCVKITGIDDSGNPITDTPSLEEIFSKLDIKGRYPLKFSDVKFDETADTIKNNVEKSGIIDRFIKKVYADDSFAFGLNGQAQITVNIYKVKENTIGVTVILNIPITELKGDEFLKTSGNITIQADYEMEIYVDLDISSLLFYDITLDTTITTSNTINLEIGGKSSIDLNQKLKNSQAYQDIISDLSSILSQPFDNESESDDTGAFKATIEILPMVLSAEIDVGAFFDVNVNLSGEIKTDKNALHTIISIKGPFLIGLLVQPSLPPIVSTGASDSYVVEHGGITMLGKATLDTGVTIGAKLIFISDWLPYLDLDTKFGLKSGLYGYYYDKFGDSLAATYDYYFSMDPYLNIDFGVYAAAGDKELYKAELLNKKFKPFLEARDKEICIKMEQKYPDDENKKYIFELTYYDVDQDKVTTKLLYPEFGNWEQSNAITPQTDTGENSSTYRFEIVKRDGKNMMLAKYDVLQLMIEIDTDNIDELRDKLSNIREEGTGSNLDSETLKAIVEKGNEANDWYTYCGSKYTDYRDALTRDKHYYNVIVDAPFSNLSQVREYLLESFSEAAVNRWESELNVIEVDGKLYGQTGFGGLGNEALTCTAKRIDDKTYEITVYVYSSETGYEADKHEKLVFENDKWVFDGSGIFGLTYYGDCQFSVQD